MMKHAIIRMLEIIMQKSNTKQIYK